MTRGVHDAFSPGRPVRRPDDAQARQELARDLSRDTLGVNEAKAQVLARLPLMEVALESAAVFAGVPARGQGT